MSETHTLYAIAHSLFSGRARSYLIKRGITYRELSTGHESFKSEVLPLAGMPTIPTLVTPGGEVIRDGAAIIEHFEASSGRPCRPDTPVQAFVSILFDVIGVEGLMRPAMHYRWNFQEENLSFLRHHFLYSQREHPQREEKTDYMMGKMQQAAVAMGVSEENVELIETLYLELLALLNEHFSLYPYLLGWQPSVGDFGLLAPLYAHLGRDPYPARIMQSEAVWVYRWVERMNRSDDDAAEFFETGSGWLPDDEIPASLIAVLKLLAEDFVPETSAAYAFTEQWLKDNAPESGAKVERFVGMNSFEVRGKTLTAVVQPYRLYLMQRVHAFYDECEPEAQSAIRSLLVEVGMDSLLDQRLSRQIGRANNLEVWI